MIKKPRKTTANSLKKSLHEIRECLNESLPNFEKKEMVGIKFSRVGTRYHIENAPVPPTDKIGVQLERSFNEVRKTLTEMWGFFIARMCAEELHSSSIKLVWRPPNNIALGRTGPS